MQVIAHCTTRRLQSAMRFGKAPFNGIRKVCNSPYTQRTAQPRICVNRSQAAGLVSTQDVKERVGSAVSSMYTFHLIAKRPTNTTVSGVSTSFTRQHTYFAASTVKSRSCLGVQHCDGRVRFC